MTGGCPGLIDQSSALAMRDEARHRGEKEEQHANPNQFHAVASSGNRRFGSGMSGKRVLYVCPLAYKKACPRGSFINQSSRTRFSTTSVDCWAKVASKASRLREVLP